MSQENIDKKVGRRLKEFRENLHLSQAEFGEKIGLVCESPASVISNYERGIRGIGPDFINKLYDFGVDLNWLLGGKCGESPVRENNINVLEKACFDAEKVQLDLLYSSKNKPGREELETAFKTTYSGLVAFYNSTKVSSMVKAMEIKESAEKSLRDLF